MDLQHAIDRVSAEISEVGALIRSLSGRYEGVFALLGSELGVTLGRSETMADAARHAIAFADAAAATFRESHPNQPVYDCKSGCSACCHLYVAVPPGVATVIAEHIEKTFTPIEREKLRARLVEAAAAANAAENPTRLRLRCPLLDEGDRCSVYDVRPLSCRAFTSTSVSRCRQIVSDKESQAGGVDQNPAHFRIHMVATLALEQAARSRGLPAQQKGLAQALLDELTVIPSSAIGSV
jgi:Fe-S-cluster containining protein